jgi:thioredoxin reductase (NADPH)
MSHQVIVVGGGIGGSAAALRAAQYHLRTAWIRGSRATAKASRGQYVYNVDNMIGLHDGMVRQKVLELLAGDEHKAARDLVEQTHFHLGTPEIIGNTVQRIRDEYASLVELVEDEAVEASQAGGLFAVTTRGGLTLAGEALVLATGAMDRQPSIRKTLKSGKVIDDIHWLYPYANHETLLYCIRCEGHLTAGTQTAVLGADEGAAQIALMLHERYETRVSLLTNGESFQAKDATRRLVALSGIGVHEGRIVDILDGGGKPRGSALRGFCLEDGTEVPARFGLIAMGLYRVYNELARQLGAELEIGIADELQHVMVEDRSSETSVRGLFAVGDMSRSRGSAPSMKQIYTAQEYAVRAMDTIDRRRRKARRDALLAETS